jgi:hypothetical protein
MARPLVAVAFLLASSMACGTSDLSEPEGPAVGNLHGPWSPNPIALPGPILQAVDAACRGSMLPFPVGVDLVVVDARGRGVVQAQYAGPNGAEAMCNDMAIDDRGHVMAEGGGSTSQGGAPHPEGAPNTLDPSGSMSSGQPVTSSVTLGRAGPGIARVAILMPGQPLTTASFANGWYLAWFPGAWPPGTTVLGFDALGQKVAEAIP